MFNFDAIEYRPEWMKPPSWRWIASEEYLADPTKRLSETQDEYIKEAASFKRELKKNIDNPEEVWKKYHQMATAFQLYLKNQNDGWKWLLEAYLMTDLTDRQISRRLNIRMPVGVVERYRKVFFDIEPYRLSKAAVMANVLSTSKVCLDASGISDYTWKIFAYTWGAAAFERMFFPNHTKRNTEHIQWLRNASSMSMDVYAYHLTSSLKSSYNENALAVINTAKAYWDIPTEEQSKLNKQAKSDFLDTLSTKIHMSLLEAPKINNVQEDFTEQASQVFYEVPNK